MPSVLRGTLPAVGSKNATLPILAATLLAPGRHELIGVPDIVDVRRMLTLLQSAGATVTSHRGVTVVDTTEVHGAPDLELSRTLRGSILMLGSLVARVGEGALGRPGGCAIGNRPIAVHLDGLRQLGAKVTEGAGRVHAAADTLTAGRLELSYPSVTGTNLLLMAATGADGVVELHGGALEPEIDQLVAFLRHLGADLRSTAPGSWRVQGGVALRPGAPYRIPPDRIEAGTWLIGAAATRGDVTIQGLPSSLVPALLDVLEQGGCAVERGAGHVRVAAPCGMTGVDVVTGPTPGFPTDLQPQLLTALTQARGPSSVEERVFECRLGHVVQLARMGADVHVHGRTAQVLRPAVLRGTDIYGSDLRGTAALMLAGFAARSPSVLHGVEHMWRGYPDVIVRAAALGGRLRAPGRAVPPTVPPLAVEAA
jgi:UDP-N-acetylglucosamine 1-carboxyvinyltransferase